MKNLKHIRRIHEWVAADPKVAPTTAPPTTRPDAPSRPSRPIPTRRPSEREKGKPMAGEPGVKPTTAPPTTRPATPTRPSRPIPSRRPSEREKGKPMATAEELLDGFFAALREKKDSAMGKRLIKNLYKKYAKGK